MRASRGPALSLLSAVLVICATSCAGGPIDDLDHISLDPYINKAGKKPVLIEFFAPWCSHCRHFEAEFKQVGRTLDTEAYVARVDGSAHHVLASRFRVKGFPSFYLVQDGKVVAYTGARSHDGLVSFVRTAGETGGEPMTSSQLGGGPFSPYWQGVRSMFVAVDSLRVAAEGYKDRPFLLFGIAFGAAMGLVAVFAIVIYIVTKPNIPTPPPRNGASATQRPHAE